EFRRCVEYEDAATLSKVPGIGRKTAERLIMEMRDKVGDVGAPSLPGQAVSVEASARSEAFDALVALGYRANEVNKLLGKLDVEGHSAEDIIRQALKQAAL
ncbi:MAG: helix-hairpin-helix domain-containing protein, partial [Gammaproteobacteria bacterium]|nr:helix-hairpin-helix domain-containing protein [Gammaproteobacteria bacterium]